MEKSRMFPTYGEITVFSHLWRNHGFSKHDVMWRNPEFFPLMEKSRIFPTFGEIPVFHTFTEFRAFFKTSVILKNSPFKVRFRIPYKNSVCFPKIPRSENYRCYKFRGFSPKKFRVLQNSPVFIFFKSLKTLEKPCIFV